MALDACPVCGTPIDLQTTCRFEDDATHRELHLCSDCCPNCSLPSTGRTTARFLHPNTP